MDRDSETPNAGDPMACSERLARQEALLLARQERALETLAGGVAHEFNNLLTGIIGYSQMALDGSADPSIHARAHSASLRAARRGSAIVARLARFAGIDPSEDGPADAAASVRDLLALLRLPLQQLQIRVEENLAEPVVLRLPREDLHAALLELVRNAMDALAEVAPEARRLTLRLGLDGDQAVLEVADTGPGMDAATLAHARDPFFTTRGALALGTSPQAKGLGLACVTAAVHRNEGSVAIDSVVGEGTTVRLTLPLRDPATAEARARVLVVDDEENIRRMFERFLRRDGFEILSAATGEEAFGVLGAERVDLVLLDHMMPGMSGLDVLERLGRETDPPPVVMITAAHSPELARKALRLGASACTSKPVNRLKIAFLAHSYARPPRGPWSLEAARVSGTEERPVGPPDHVLVVEQDGLVRDVLTLVLQRGGYRVSAVGTAAEARVVTEKEYFDLILVDTVLHDDAAEDTVRDLRFNNPYTPILIHTSGLDPAEARRLRRAGATLAVSKTVEVEHLVSEVDTLIRIFREEVGGR
ncbi:MAG: response regulator [Planctomycetota bacterium]